MLLLLEILNKLGDLNYLVFKDKFHNNKQMPCCFVLKCFVLLCLSHILNMFCIHFTIFIFIRLYMSFSYRCEHKNWIFYIN